MEETCGNTSEQSAVVVGGCRRVEGHEIQLGFAESLSDTEEQHEHEQTDPFPSRVGGRPQWLIPEGIPDANRLKCMRCGEIMSFLLQIYAPLHSPPTYHRSIYIFCCRKFDCIKYCPEGSFKVFRAQLSKENKYYKPIDTKQMNDKDEQYVTIEHPQRLCRVSGLYGTYRCSGCQVVYYADKKFQREDWDLTHKQECQSIQKAKISGGPVDELTRQLTQKIKINDRTSKPLYKCQFIDYDIVTEAAKCSIQFNPEKDTQPIEEVEDDSVEEESVAAQNQKIIDHYNKITQRYDRAEFENHDDWIVSEAQKDIFFKNFLTISSQEPEQILRYYEDINMSPIWVSGANRPEKIKPCACGSERRCEFQIMPQLLYLLHLEEEDTNTMDWGTLAIYTCKLSCGGGEMYHEEWLFPQQISK